MKVMLEPRAGRVISSEQLRKREFSSRQRLGERAHPHARVPAPRRLVAGQAKQTTSRFHLFARSSRWLQYSGLVFCTQVRNSAAPRWRRSARVPETSSSTGWTGDVYIQSVFCDMAASTRRSTAYQTKENTGQGVDRTSIV
jgi:hypothetical protein